MGYNFFKTYAIGFFEQLQRLYGPVYSQSEAVFNQK